MGYGLVTGGIIYYSLITLYVVYDLTQKDKKSDISKIAIAVFSVAMTINFVYKAYHIYSQRVEMLTGNLFQDRYRTEKTNFAILIGVTVAINSISLLYFLYKSYKNSTQDDNQVDGAEPPNDGSMASRIEENVR